MTLIELPVRSNQTVSSSVYDAQCRSSEELFSTSSNWKILYLSKAVFAEPIIYYYMIQRKMQYGMKLKSNQRMHFLNEGKIGNTQCHFYCILYVTVMFDELCMYLDVELIFQRCHCSFLAFHLRHWELTLCLHLLLVGGLHRTKQSAYCILFISLMTHTCI